MKKVLVTGITGFAGSHLADRLTLNSEYEVYGTYLSDKSLANVAHIKDKIHLTKVDLINEADVLSLVTNVKPDIVFHLAAFAATGESFQNPSSVITNNIASQVNLFEGLRKNKLEKTRVLVVSSAEVYGMVQKDMLPINENTPLRPVNPYSVSKIAQDFLGLQYVLSYGFDIVRVRPFNHIGPRQTPQFVVASFAKKIAEIEKGLQKPILSVGNLEAKRDFTDVRDMVCAYELLIEKGEAGEVYNVGSGVSHKISDILQTLLSFSTSKIEIKVDPALLRPIDTQEIVCDCSKMQKLTGWKAKILLDKSLKDTLDYWRGIV